MANSDPQSKRKRTWGEFLFGDEKSAAAKAQYKREMGINPAAKAQQNVESAISAKAMDNPTSRPARTEASRGKKVELRGAAGTYTKPYDKKRSAAGTYTKSYDKKASSTPNASSGAAKSAKAAGDKSSQANKGKPTSATGTPAKKMTAFERQKARMYEKEGYGGRSMTTERAKAQVMKERGQKLEIPRFGKAKTANKQAPKMSEIKYKSQKARDFAAKMQGQRPSGKAEKKFRFKDLFK